MNTSSALVSEKTLHELDVKAFWNTHLSDLKERLETVSQPNKKAAIRKAIADAEFRVREIEYMETLAVGQWVSSKINKKAGQIDSLRFAGKVPEAQVTWWGSAVPVPERPLNLIVLDDEQLGYRWNHDKFPKLVRVLDGLECKDVDALQQALDQAKNELRNSDSRLFGGKLHAGKPKTDGGQLRCIEASVPPFVTENATEDEDDRSSEFQLKVNYCNKRIAYFKLPRLVSISDINRNGGTQQRIKFDPEAVKEYAEAMRQGDKFPPVKLTYDGTDYWLTDGFHTTEAAWSIGQKSIEAIVTKGSQRDAILASVAVNSDHGLRRSNADKRRAVTTLLEDQEWGQWSDREIARRCRVHHSTVAKIRQELTGYLASYNPKNDNKIITGEFPSDKSRTYKDKHGNVSKMNTENIGTDASAFGWEADPKRDAKLAVGQIVRIKSDRRSDERLVGYNLRVAVITQVNTASVDLKTWGQLISNVAINDLEILDQSKLPSLCFCPDAEDYAIALTGFDSPEDMLKAAVAVKKFL